MAHAAPKPPVQWRAAVSARTVRPGTAFSVRLAGTLDPGWHLYALEEPEGGPVATEISLMEGDPADLIRVEQATPRTLNDPLFSQPTSFFAGTATFTLHLRLNRGTAAGTHSLHVLVRYQSCNDRLCLPPHTDALEVPVQAAR